MRPLPAIFLTLALVILCGELDIYAKFNPFPIVILGTALWVAIDSSKIGLRRYKSGISYRPLVLFILTLLLWIIAFPWYLIMRHKIKAGKAVLKADA